LNEIEKIVGRIEKIFIGIGGVMFMGLMFLGAGDVAGRYLFNKPLLGAMEASEVLMAGIILLAWAYTQRTGGHVKVELIVSRYSPRIQALTGFVTLFLSLLLFICIFRQSLEIAIQFWKEQRVFQTLPGPSAPYHFFVPIGAFFLCLEFIIQMIRLVPLIRTGK
jgi:TRAP-type C4-dicarboxylate transport system permease small subunit